MKLVNQKEGIYQSFKKMWGRGVKKREEINQQAGTTPKPTSVNLKYALEWKTFQRKTAMVKFQWQKNRQSWKVWLFCWGAEVGLGPGRSLGVLSPARQQDEISMMFYSLGAILFNKFFFFFSSLSWLGKASWFLESHWIYFYNWVIFKLTVSI